jgi:hypothetical protein
MYELKKYIGKLFKSKFVGTGPSFYKKRIYRAAVSQRLRNTALKHSSVVYQRLQITGIFRSVVILLSHELNPRLQVKSIKPNCEIKRAGNASYEYGHV